MPRPVEPSLNERAFVLEALTSNIRVDRRPLTTFRPLTLTFPSTLGLSDVQLGRTRVIANVSAEVTAPFPDRPFDGIFAISTELSPMASVAFDPGRPTDMEVSLSRLLEKTLRRSSALDTESLCLVAAKKVWSVRVDVHVVAHDGNLVDAACIAVVAALQHFRKSDTSVEGGEVVVYTPAEREPTPLSLLHLPFCATAVFFRLPPGSGDDETVAVWDASLLEEQLCDGRVTVGMNRHGEVCQVAKLGGVPVDAVAILQCMTIAGERIRHISKVVTERLQEDAKLRDNGCMMAELSAENAR